MDCRTGMYVNDVQAFRILSDPDTPFVSVNVAGLDDYMFSDTLFGHVKGAYTGALESRKGLIEKHPRGFYSWMK